MKLFRKEAIEFQRSKLIGEVFLNTPPKYTLYTIIFIFMFLIFILFILSNNFSRKEKALGFLTSNLGEIKLKSTSTAVLDELNVYVGKKVKKGDILYWMKSEVGLETGHSRVSELMQSIAREIEKLDQKEENSKRLFQLRKSSLLQSFDDLENDIKFNKQERDLIDELLKIHSHNFKKSTELAKQGVISNTELDSSKIAKLSTEQRALAVKKRIYQLEEKRKTIKNEQEILSVAHKEALNDLENSREQLLKQKIELSSQGRFSITSPIDGVVTSLFGIEGSQIPTGLPILTLKPDGSEIIAKLIIPSSSIGLLTLNQKVSIKYDSFPFQRFGIFDGHIQRISSNALNPSEFVGPISLPESFFIVDVKLDHKSISAYGRDIKLLAGMKLEAEVIIETTTIFEWFLSPIRAFQKNS